MIPGQTGPEEAGAGHKPAFKPAWKTTGLSRKGQQVLMLAMVAANPGKAAFEVAALQEFMHRLGDDAS